MLGFTKIFQPVRGLAEKAIVLPIKQKVFDWQRAFKKDLNGCQLKNDGEIAGLKAKIASLTEENLAQKRLLSAPLPKNWQFMPAKVISVQEETLTIDQGKNDGVKEGMAAVLDNNYVGRVDKVSEKLSQVRLPSFMDERLFVKIVSAQNADMLGKGLVIGKGAGQIKIEQILATEPVAKGNLVISEVEGQSLLVGEIEEISEKNGEVFKTAQVKRFYNPEELNTIFLVRGKI